MLKTILNENKKYLKQTILISKADLVKTYKGAALGYAWAVIKPIVTIFVYLFAFTFIRNGAKMDGHPYFIWLVAGIMPWFFINESIITGAMSIRYYKHFVTKIKFPVSTIPTFVLLSKLYVHVMLVVGVSVIFACAGYFPDKYYLQLLYYIPTMYITFLVLSWSLSALSVISRDFENLVKSSIMALLWLTPILWNIKQVSSPVLRFILKLNPINYFVEGYRNIFMYEQWFFAPGYFKYTIYIWIFIGVFAFIGSRIYKRVYKDFADVL